MLVILAGCLSAFPGPRRLSAASDSSIETLQQVQQLIQKGDFKAARGRLVQALKDSPGEAGYYDLLGVVDAEEGQYAAAEAHFTQAIEKNPHLAGAYLNLGHLYQDNVERDPDALRKGLDVYRRLLAFEPGNVEAAYQTAWLLERLGSFKSSLQYLARLPAADQHRSQALAVRCGDFAGLGERSHAASAATELLSSADLTEADALPVVAAFESHRDDDLEARLLEGLVERRLASSASLARLGRLYQRQGKLQKARDTLEKAAEAEPKSVPLLVDLARVANEEKDYTGALGYLAHARALDPENAGVHFFFGMICVEQNLVHEAYESLKKAVSLDPNNAYYNYAMGAVAVGRDDPRESLPYFRKYCELKPRDPRGRLSLGIAYFYSHDGDSARKELEVVSKDRSTAPAAHCFLGRIANQQGDLAEAARQLTHALEENPDYADALAELGIVRMKQKQNDLAKEALLKALKLDPDHYAANLNLMILYRRMNDPRAREQVKRFEQVTQLRQARAKEFLRTIRVVP